MPTDGIASAASALRYWERRQEVASNNLANVNTDGFKAERVFARLVAGQSPVPQTANDLREGSITSTGNPLDVALRGEGNFFVVGTPNGERWSRGGSWGISAEGFLVDADGNKALGEHGPIQAKGKDISIDRTGMVTVDGKKVDRLRVEAAPPGATLMHEAGTHFIPDANKTSIVADQRDIRQGALEGSNVNTISSLVDLISISRNFADAQKALTTLDNVRATISNDLGKVPA